MLLYQEYDMLKKSRYLCFLFFFSQISLSNRDIIIEFKGSNLPTFQANIIFGPEITFQLAEKWYGFTSAEFFLHKNYPAYFFSFGIKYFIPFRNGNFYLGLGFQPTWLLEKHESYHFKQHTFLPIPIVKIGSYFNLPNNCVFDLFAELPFPRIGMGLGYRF